MSLVQIRELTWSFKLDRGKNRMSHLYLCKSCVYVNMVKIYVTYICTHIHIFKNPLCVRVKMLPGNSRKAEGQLEGCSQVLPCVPPGRDEWKP